MENSELEILRTECHNQKAEINAALERDKLNNQQINFLNSQLKELNYQKIALDGVFIEQSRINLQEKIQIARLKDGIQALSNQFNAERERVKVLEKELQDLRKQNEVLTQEVNDLKTSPNNDNMMVDP